MFSTDEHKVECFLEGVCPELNQDVRMTGTQGVSFAVIADQDLITEQAGLVVEARETQKMSQRSYFSPRTWNKDHQTKPRWSNNKRLSKINTKNPLNKKEKLKILPHQLIFQLAKNVGNSMAVNVDTEKRVCYTCGKSGHMRRDCPPKPTNVVPDESICVSWGNSGTTDNDVVTSTLLDGGKLAYTIFDSNATY